MGVVTLDVAEWKSKYPQYNALTDQQVEDLFYAATTYLENTPQSVIADEDKRKYFLYLLTAHLAYLFYVDANGNGGVTGMVGRLSSASEGSVSVGSAMSNVPFNAEFFLQSPYGFTFWQATKIYRMGFYRGRCR
ncbi:TPA: DUF4054 domain-containing protein [Enterobacter roggenkampii]|uniref:DUF4054 domain-containing protein n=1 Tax=Enterobacter roggenkampii TaxID=1812935 RepID=UPI000386AF23|nr:DUF4054 domain-containing protein [Enterobacter roggenkampii]CAH5458670.1 hypothetical protein AI2941V1_0226 [Enterobacter cloacae]DAJ89734.1 MAG TPA: head to tail adaptor [Caudoviricetes sp.]EPY97140.1 hypothetical protein L799_09015 [Enterobacter roggenkampii EC_38VIM1]KTK00419.1 hypothetical protein ASU70_07405 [Enterobacter roggenkampii]MCC7579586.1 DUF4054 domain-containing protein [Enterobacter roggenkampii]